MDGDISNSDYDIITDITKINTLIFSQDIKYTGATNKSASAFRDFLAGKVSAPLFENTQTPTNTGSVQG